MPGVSSTEGTPARVKRLWGKEQGRPGQYAVGLARSSRACRPVILWDHFLEIQGKEGEKRGPYRPVAG